MSTYFRNIFISLLINIHVGYTTYKRLFLFILHTVGYQHVLISHMLDIFRYLHLRKCKISVRTYSNSLWYNNTRYL